MRKLFFTLLILIANAAAQTTLPNLGLQQFPYQFPRYDIGMNANIALLDAMIPGSSCATTLSWNGITKQFVCNSNSPAFTALTVTGTASSKRYDVNQATTLVTGDLTLSAGWGSTASTAITLATSKDQASVTTITTGGTGIAANPTYQLTFHDGTWTQVPVCRAQQTGGNDILGDFTVTSRSATAYTFQWNATPTTGKTYEVTIMCIGT